MKTLIIILSLFNGSLFAQFVITPEQMRNMIKTQENYVYYFGLDSINQLEMSHYKIIIDKQNSIIINKDKEIEIINLQLDKCRKTKITYKWVAIGVGVIAGVLLIKG